MRKLFIWSEFELEQCRSIMLTIANQAARKWIDIEQAFAWESSNGKCHRHSNNFASERAREWFPNYAFLAQTHVRDIKTQLFWLLSLHGIHVILSEKKASHESLQHTMSFASASYYLSLNEHAIECVHIYNKCKI